MIPASEPQYTPAPWWIAFTTIAFSACLALMSALLLARRNDKKEDRQRRYAREKEDRDWKNSVEQRMTVLNTQVSPLWLVAQQKLSADLHHHGERYREMDVLLEELDAMTIDDFPGHREELERLLVLRSQDMHQDITQDQRDSATALVIVMKKVLTESKIDKPLINIGLVGVKESSTGEGENIGESV